MKTIVEFETHPERDLSDGTWRTSWHGSTSIALASVAAARDFEKNASTLILTGGQWIEIRIPLARFLSLWHSALVSK